MSVRVVLRRLVAAVTAGVSATAVVLAVPSAQATLPRAEDRAGSAGIGDPYFPLDGNGGIDVLRYDVRNRYGLHSGRLRGQTRLTIRATQPLDSFHLDFLLPVQQVTVDGRTVDFRRSGSHELVVQTRGIATGRHFTVVVDYDGRPAEHSYLGEQNWLAGDHEVVAMNQPHMAAWWYPSNDHPLDKARHDIRITVPRGREVVANGLLVGRERHGRLVTWHWRSTDPMASYLAFFAAGDFEIRTGRHQGLPWINAVSRELAPQARRVALRWLGRTPRITAWLTQEIGPYPFESTGGLVTSLWPGFALENQTRPTYPFVGGQADWLLVHELAHQWFGNSVAVEHWRDIWLNEGFATYFEARWVEARGGETVEQWLARSYDQHDADSTFWKTGVADPGPGGLFDSAVYERGGMTLAALRALLGVDTFQALVRTWAHEQHDGNGSTEEFVATAERVSGRELDGFFRAWLSVPTRPERVADNGLSARVG